MHAKTQSYELHLTSCLKISLWLASYLSNYHKSNGMCREFVKYGSLSFVLFLIQSTDRENMNIIPLTCVINFKWLAVNSRVGIFIVLVMYKGPL